MSDLVEVVELNAFCRICLTQRQGLIWLNSPLPQSNNVHFLPAHKRASIKNALETVMSIKIEVLATGPTKVCKPCLEFLENSYTLKLRFLETQEILAKLQKLPNPICKIPEATVEIIAGNNKYDIKDVVIVEEEKNDLTEYEGFLNNLGKTVTASFVTKSGQSRKKQSEEEPVLWIEEVGKTEESELSSDEVEKIIIIPEASPERNEGAIEEPGKEDFENLSNLDLELIQSALNMQLQCPHCDKIYAKKGRYKKHIEVCSKEQCQWVKPNGSVTLKNGLTCLLCGRQFRGKKYLNYHKRTVHDTSTYECESCKMTFNTFSRYRYHNASTHSERSYICDVCGKRFRTNNALKIHSDLHKNVTQCVCPICGKGFNYKGGLFYHMKIHTNERKHECDYCDKKFYTCMAKKRHILTHTRVRSFQCSYCGRKFFSGGELRKHEYTHTGDTPYRCQFCDKTFTSRFNMKLHLTTYQGSHMCHVCNRGFISDDILKLHIRQKHKCTEEVPEDS